jgi:hypothetical protein
MASVLSTSLRRLLVFRICFANKSSGKLSKVTEEIDSGLILQIVTDGINDDFSDAEQRDSN